MPRTKRAVIVGCAHHVTQRGNNRQDVFFVDDDRRVFMELLESAANRFGLKIHGYCLMTNHIHLLAEPRTESALHLALKRTNQLYSQYVNRAQGRSGHLWEGRFFSCPMDESYYWTAMSYVERNPVRAKMVRKAWLYPWSSAAIHCGLAAAAAAPVTLAGTEQFDAASWREVLMESQDKSELSLMRLSTSRGRPLGSDSFISKLEIVLGRRLRALPHGRPRKEA